MPPPALPHPEFEDCAQARAARAVLAILRGDAPIKNYCAQIDDYELEALATNADSVTPPAFVVVLDAWDRGRAGSNRQGKITTLVELLLLHQVEVAVGTQQFLQTRILERVVRLIEARKGILVDENGDPITEALLQVQRVAQGTRVGTLVGKRLQLLFTSSIHVETGEFLP